MTPRVVALLDAVPDHLVEEVRALVSSGGVLSIPTDTLYGLAADPLSAEGVERIYALKGRESGKALPVLAASLASLEGLGVMLDQRLRRALSKLWPAPVTVVVPLASPIPASGGERTLAVRIPDRRILCDLLARVGPLTATSANRSGETAARSAAEVVNAFGADVPLVLDGGPAETTLPSTLVDATTMPPRILRAGARIVDPSLFS